MDPPLPSRGHHEARRLPPQSHTLLFFFFLFNCYWTSIFWQKYHFGIIGCFSTGELPVFLCVLLIISYNHSLANIFIGFKEHFLWIKTVASDLYGAFPLQNFTRAMKKVECFWFCYFVCLFWFAVFVFVFFPLILHTEFPLLPLEKWPALEEKQTLFCCKINKEKNPPSILAEGITEINSKTLVN